MVLIRLLILLSLTNAAYASIGEVTETTGSGVILRESSLFDADLAVPVNMDDEVKTAKGVVGITFDDDTQVKVGEHSELIIDDFVYDPTSSSGSLGLLVTMGTVKYSSGQLAHNNPDSVDIKTPSATIAVRGTAFSMTVNELGDSLIVLLPNSDGSVGEIVVETDVGQVILNRAFQLTATFNRDAAPTPPAIIQLTEDQINNLMIISPPVKSKEDKMFDAISDALDEDLLEYDELENELEKEGDQLAFDELSINELSVDLLTNMLNSAFSEHRDGRDIGYNDASQVYTFINDPEGRVVRYSNNAMIDIVFNINSGMNAAIIQPDTTVNIETLDDGSTNVIRITQK